MKHRLPSFLILIGALLGSMAAPVGLRAANDANSVSASVNHVASGQTIDGDTVGVLTDVVVDGHVRGKVVAVMANATINGRVDQDVVAVMGNLTLGPDAWVGGNVTCVGGHVRRDPRAYIGGRVVEQTSRLSHAPLHFNAWWKSGPRRGRVLAFGPHLRWTWLFALAALAFYALMALVMPRQIRTCGDVLARRPGLVVLTALLTLLALPVLAFLFFITLLGIPVAIFVLPSAVILFTMFGKASICALIGRRVAGDRLPAALAVLLGGAICLAFCAIPIFGLVLTILLAYLGLGCSVAGVIVSRGPRGPASAGPIPPPLATMFRHDATNPPVVPPKIPPAAL